jgi:hypothetical protein
MLPFPATWKNKGRKQTASPNSLMTNFIVFPLLQDNSLFIKLCFALITASSGHTLLQRPHFLH